MKKIKAVIFDMDGVIFDSEPAIEQHDKFYFGKMGVVFPEDYFHKIKGMHAREYWSRIIEDFKLSITIEEIFDDARKSLLSFLKSNNNLEPVSGVKELITHLRKKKYKVALASSANPKRVDLLLKKFEIKRNFDVITNADHVKHGKPSPDIYLYTAKLLKVSPEACLVIEDAENGIKAGKAAGMKVIGFAGLVHNKQDLSQADKVIKSFDELDELFDSGSSRGLSIA